MARAPPPVETWERRPGAALAPLPETPRYRRREPERTLLHQVVRSRLEPFLAAAKERSPSCKGLPTHVERDLRGYLDCGLLARGFARIRCGSCGFERLVAFSCKCRTCPSCNARRMEDAADHLAHDVFPAVPVRQWVLSLPRALRFQAARQPAVAARLLDLFTRALFAWLRRQGRAHGVDDPRTAGCTAVQRFGGVLNLNVHFHTLVPDGVFDLSDAGVVRFVKVKGPSDDEVAAILTRVIRRAARAGLLGAEVPDGDAEDALAALQAAEVERRLRFPDPFKHARRSAHLDGFSLHAGVRIHEHDREGLERLCRYAMRPPLAMHRLSPSPDGTLVYRMKRPRGGSLFLVLTPDALVARLATLVPPPRTHALRYHGLFAPHCKDRGRVVPAGPWLARCHAAAPGAQPAPAADHARPPSATQPRLIGLPPPERPGAPLSRPPQPPCRAGPRTRVPWANLLRKVFAVDVLACPTCGGRLEVLAFITEQAVARKILDHLGLASQAPPLAPARAPADDLGPEGTPALDLVDASPDYAAADPGWPD